MSNGAFKIDYSFGKDDKGNEYQITSIDDKFYAITIVCRRCQTTITSRATNRPDIILTGHDCIPSTHYKCMKWVVRGREFF